MTFCKSKKILYFVVVLFFIISVVAAYFGAKLSNIQILQLVPTDYDPESSSRIALLVQKIFIAVILASFIMMMWTVCLHRCNGKVLLLLYCLAALAVSTFFILSGVVFLMAGAKGQNWIEIACEDLNNGAGFSDISNQSGSIVTLLSQTDEKLYSLINSNMCTHYCSCFQGSGNLKKFNQINEKVLNQYGRTRHSAKADQYSLTYWNSIPIISHSSLKHCYEFLKGNEMDPDLARYTSEIDFKKFEDVEIFLYALEKVEMRFDCSGVCRPPLFYYSVDLDRGRPHQTCVGPVFDEYRTDAIIFGALLLSSGGLLLTTLCFTCHLWRTDPNDKAAPHPSEESTIELQKQAKSAEFWAHDPKHKGDVYEDQDKQTGGQLDQTDGQYSIQLK